MLSVAWNTGGAADLAIAVVAQKALNNTGDLPVAADVGEGEGIVPVRVEVMVVDAIERWMESMRDMLELEEQIL